MRPAIFATLGFLIISNNACEAYVSNTTMKRFSLVCEYILKNRDFPSFVLNVEHLRKTSDNVSWILGCVT